MFTRQYFLIPICYLVCNARVNKHATLPTLPSPGYTYTWQLAPTHLSYYSQQQRQSPAAMKRHDFVIFGASGFTGQFVVQGGRNLIGVTLNMLK